MTTTFPVPLVEGSYATSVCRRRLMGDSNGEIQYLTNRLVETAPTHEMEVSAEKSKIMTNSTTNTSADISMNRQKLQEVTSFKYLGTTLCKDGTCSADVRIRIASAMAAMAGLNRIWRCNTIRSASKFKLYKSPGSSSLLYGCETRTLLADSEERIQALETKCMRNFSVSPTWRHKTND